VKDNYVINRLASSCLHKAFFPSKEGLNQCGLGNERVSIMFFSEITNSLSKELLECEVRLAALRQGELNMMLDELNKVRKSFAQCESRIAEQDNQLAEKDDQLDYKDRQLDERDSQMEEKDRLLVKRNSQLAESEQRNRDLLDSASWRLTAPLRAVYEIIKRLKRSL
jgi:chromosome segregation ATPase